MLGAIIGDIVGSIYEFNNHRSKEFKLFDKKCFFTDDTVMTCAIAKSILDCKGDYKDLSEKTIKNMQNIGLKYKCSYGASFMGWLLSKKPSPYYSYGNGSAMRVSAVSWVARSEEEVKRLSEKVTSMTHNHPEGLKGAEATAMCIYLARMGKRKTYIRDYVEKNYYELDFSLDSIRETYMFNETCRETVPQAIEAFLESDSFEDAIRNAISIGGDSDTLAAITGSIAEAYYGIPTDIREKAKTYLDQRLLSIVDDFEITYGTYEDKWEK